MLVHFTGEVQWLAILPHQKHTSNFTSPTKKARMGEMVGNFTSPSKLARSV
jgi:hypothetical protein